MDTGPSDVRPIFGKNFLRKTHCGAIAKKKQTKNVYNLDTIAAAWLIAILS